MVIYYLSDNSVDIQIINNAVLLKYYVAAHSYAPNAVDEKDYHLLLYKNTAVIKDTTLAAGNSNGRGKMFIYLALN